MSTQVRDRLLAAFVAELAEGGLTDVVICPGSRSTPVTLALHRQGGFRLHVALDERSAAFFALGLGKASGRAAAVVAPSGTAAANFLPAVVEARYSHTPLLLLTADRPRALRDTGAAQTIDQVHLYGTHAKVFAEFPDSEADAATLAFVRRLAARLLWAAAEPPRGPVHLNLPLAEPLLPGSEDGERTASAPVDRPHLVLAHTRPSAPADVLPAWASTDLDRLLVLAGPDAPAEAYALARHLAAPLLADPLSGQRCHEDVVDAYDLLLRDPTLVEALTPRAVVRFGEAPVSKPLAQALARWQEGGTRFLRFLDEEPHRDPFLLPEVVLPVAASAQLARQLPAEAAATFRALWRRLGKAARSAATEALRRAPLGEATVFPLLCEALPADGALFLGNSMPVRDADAFLPAPVPFAVYGNRGASGIDGVLSTALGVAAVRARPTVLVVGDLSFYHDQNGLLLAREGIPLTILLIHNDGGGIFSFLPQAGLPEFERYFGTPHGLDFEHTARLYGLPFHRASTPEDLAALLRSGIGMGRTNILLVPSERQENVRQHEEAVAAALSAARAELATGGHSRWT